MAPTSRHKGNLHKISNFTHRWLMPTHKFSARDAKTLIFHCLNALSLQSTSTPTGDVAATSNPNPNPNSGLEPGPCNNVDNHSDQNDSNCNNGSEPESCQLDFDKLDLDRGHIMDNQKDLKEGEEVKDEEEQGEIRDEKLLEGENCLGKLIKEPYALVEEKKCNNVENEDKTKVLVNFESEVLIFCFASLHFFNTYLV